MTFSVISKNICTNVHTKQKAIAFLLGHKVNSRDVMNDGDGDDDDNWEKGFIFFTSMCSLAYHHHHHQIKYYD